MRSLMRMSSKGAGLMASWYGFRWRPQVGLSLLQQSTTHNRLSVKPMFILCHHHSVGVLTLIPLSEHQLYRLCCRARPCGSASNLKMRSGSFCSLDDAIVLALARTSCTMPLTAGIEWQRRAAGVSDSQQSRLLCASRLASTAGQC